MTVIIRPLPAIQQRGSTVSPVFTDSFARASGPLGSQWVQGNHMFTPAATPAQLQDATVATSLIDGLQCLRWASQNGAANPNWVLHGFAFPIPNYSLLLNRSQYVQCRIINSTGAGAERATSGMATMARGDEDSAYALECLPSINVVQLLRVTASTTVVLSGWGAPGCANGDLFRLNCVLSAGQNDFTLIKNGVLVPLAVSDIGAPRLTVGVPGFWVRGSGGVLPGIAEWRSFESGPL